jgi:hypothetical protein
MDEHLKPIPNGQPQRGIESEPQLQNQPVNAGQNSSHVSATHSTPTQPIQDEQRVVSSRNMYDEHDEDGDEHHEDEDEDEHTQGTSSRFSFCNDQPGRALAIFVFSPLLLYRAYTHKDMYIGIFAVILFVWNMYFMMYTRPNRSYYGDSDDDSDYDSDDSDSESDDDNNNNNNNINESEYGLQ